MTRPRQSVLWKKVGSSTARLSSGWKKPGVNLLSTSNDICPTCSHSMKKECGSSSKPGVSGTSEGKPPRTALRVMAFLAKFLSPGEDPVKTVAGLMATAGWDVDPEVMDWVDSDPED
jgi:hypothetical protein